jgi:hypothetical protein
MRTYLLVAGLLLSLVHPAIAAPNALQTGAVEKFRGQAKELFETASKKSSDARRKAADPAALFPAHRTAVRGEIAKELRGARKSARELKLSLSDARSKHAMAVQAETNTQAEVTAAETQRTESKSKLSWMARTFNVAIRREAREALATYNENDTTHATLADRLSKEKNDVTKLGKSVERYEHDRDAMVKRIGTLRQRNWKTETDARVREEVAALETDATTIEANAKASVRSLVLTWVAEQLHPQRAPIEAAYREADEADTAGQHVEHAITHAENAVDQTLSNERAGQVNDAVEMLFGQNMFQDFARDMNDFSAASDASVARSALSNVNAKVGEFRQRMESLRNMTSVMQHGGVSNTAAGRVDANVTLVAYVDLALDFTRFNGAFSNIIGDQFEINQLNRANDQLSSLRGRINETRRQLGNLQQSLGDSLRKLDAHSAEIVEGAVAELTKR